MIGANVMVLGGQNAYSENARCQAYLNIDGLTVNNAFGFLDCLVDNTRFSIGWPCHVTFAGYLAPGVHVIDFGVVGASTNPNMDNVPSSVWCEPPRMSLLLL